MKSQNIDDHSSLCSSEKIFFFLSKTDKNQKRVKTENKWLIFALLSHISLLALAALMKTFCGNFFLIPKQEPKISDSKKKKNHTITISNKKRSNEDKDIDFVSCLLCCSV
jgi:hypothetical protein